MQSYARTLWLTIAIALVSIATLLLIAAPQSRRPLHSRPAADDTTIVKANPPDTGAPPPPPITFSDPDGQELVMEELSVRTAVHGMLSLTELELRFRNPQARRIEGRFTCTLPQNAAISRFAKEVNGQLMEGEVVERLRANQVYEQFLHVMRDPALLEQDQGNRFSARVFPIEANAPVRLVLSYTQLLPMRGGVRTYTLPLRGMSKINKLTFRAFVTPIADEAATGKVTTSTAEVTSFDERDWTPDRDITLEWRSDRTEPIVLRAGDFYLAALRPNVTPSNQQQATHNWLFYLDTSASSAEGAEHRIRALTSLLGALPSSDSVQLLAFDNEVVELGRGTASRMARDAGELLRARLFLGGTDAGAMLRDLASRANASTTAVVVSDLAATLGDTSANQLQSAIARIPANAGVHALILGSREDAPLAKALTAGRGRVVRVPFTESLATRAAQAVDELRRPVGRTISVTDAGAEWTYPNRIDDVAPGDEVLVLGKVRPGDEPRIAAGAMKLDAATFGPLLEREAYRAYLEYLAEREANEPSDAVRRALATEQVKISVEQRVVIPRTTMLVLESEWDYQRFGLDRRALAKILTIEAGGIGRLDRRVNDTPMPVPVTRKEGDLNRTFNEPRVVTAPVAAPEAVPPPEDFVAEATEEVGVEGGVLGGVVGGSVGGVVATDAVRESITVTQSAPMVAPPPERIVEPAPPPPPPPTPRPALRREEPKQESSDWTRVSKPPRSRIDSLEAQLRDNPRDREVYNQLGETLAALEEWSSLRRLALRWQPYDPENPQVYELLGNADLALGNETEAARAYASLIEVAPSKTELLQRAGLLLLRARRAKLAEAPLRRALEVRPDRANGYRHLALLLWQDGRIEEAARVLESATRQSFPAWYGNVQRVIREELGYVYRAWLKKDPARRRDIEDRAREYAVDLDRRDALRVTLAWETDANDVDLHVVDPAGDESFYAHRDTKSGLTLYEDITQGLGPEVIRTSRVDGGTYHVGVRYFAAGPMGVSRGLVIVMRDDTLEVHPFRLVKGGEEIRYVTAVRVK